MAPRSLGGVALAALILAIAADCSRAAPDAVAVAAHGLVMPTTLGLDDVFEARVYGEADMSGVYRVASDGTISLPLVGRVQVAGMTPSEAGEALAAQLAQYFRNPHVAVFVKEYNSKKVYVFGEVRNPGTFAFSPGMNIIQAITSAGGFEKLADKDATFVTRLREGQEQRLRVSVKAIGEGRTANFQLEPGDIVYVPETYF